MSSDMTATCEILRGWLESRTAWQEVVVRPRQTTLGAGFSADIFFVDVEYINAGVRDARTLVVRRQPQTLEVVHGSSLELQGRMMETLARRDDVPMPPWIGMELDSAVLGMPFLIMGKVDGQAAKQTPNFNLEGWLKEMRPDYQFATWRNGIEAMAKLALIDWRDGFQFLASPEHGSPGLDQYVGQLEEWHQVAGRGRQMTIVDHAIGFVRNNMPTDARVNVLWGDPTPSNILFDADGHVNALVDWELATLGPAELDLAWWLYMDDLFSRRFGVPRLPGLPTHAEMIGIWERATGFSALNLDYYDIVVALRMALVAVGAFDRQVGLGNISSDNNSLNANFMTLYLAERLGLPAPVLGEDFVAFMKNLTPVKMAD